MRGTNRGVVVIQPRDRALLEALDTMRVLNREQAAAIAGFTSVTRVNARLLKLTHSGLLSTLTVGTSRGGHQHLYARTRAGAALVRHEYRTPPWNAQSPIVAGQPLLEHQLRLNQLYLAWRSLDASSDTRLEEWRTFTTAPIPTAAPLIPDAFCILRTAEHRRALFIEIDLATEPHTTWHRKVDRYLAVARSGQFQTVFGFPQFSVAVVVPSTGRLHRLRHTIASRTDKLFFLTTFESLSPGRITSAVWWRPSGTSSTTIH